MPASISNDVLAYIGVAAIAFVVIKLLSAPFFLWKEQVQAIGRAEAELRKPERVEAAYLAKVRAKNKMQLAGLLREVYWRACDRSNPDDATKAMIKLMGRGISLMGKADVGEAFNTGYAYLPQLAFAFLDKGDEGIQMVMHHLINALLGNLHGNITNEALALRLPQDTELKKLL